MPVKNTNQESNEPHDGALDWPFPWAGLGFWHDKETGQALGEWLYDEETVYGKQIFPPRGLRLEAFKRSSYSDTHVVLLGEAPSTTEGYSNGLAYGVLPGVHMPPSTRNIFRELEREGIKPPKDASLHGWAKQGVLLLNSDLTCEKDDETSHDGMWFNLIDEVITVLLMENDEPIVFMLWGDKAQEVFRLSAPDQNEWLAPALVLEAASPRAKTAQFFIGCGHFALANQFLRDQGVPPINWSL